MFILTLNTDINLGDTIILKKDFIVIGGIFTKGHIFKVIEIYDTNGYGLKCTLTDNDNNIIKNVPLKICNKNLNYKDSSDIQTKINYKKEVLDCIKKNCTKSIIEDDDKLYISEIDYDMYLRYTLKKSNEWHYVPCKPKIRCIKYSLVAQKKYPNILRNLKIKNIKL